MLECALDCCFRMYRVPDYIAPDCELLWDQWLGDGDDWDRDLYAVCTATKEEWEREVTCEEGVLVEIDDEYICGGGVPYDCPIYQGEVAPPWEENQKQEVDNASDH